jgi:hypothetical protein
MYQKSPMYPFDPKEHGYEDDNVPEGRNIYVQIPGRRCELEECKCRNHFCQLYFGFGIFVPTDEKIPITFQRSFR